MLPPEPAGLAAKAASVSAPVSAPTAAPEGADMLQKIIDMLLAGTPPEELIAQGIAEELVTAAIEAILAQADAEEAAAAQPGTPAGKGMLGAGLAGAAIQ